MANAKNQHWVPRFYLRHFATPETRDTDEPKTWIFSKHEGTPQLTNIRNICGKRYLYTPKRSRGGRSWQMEEMLAALESEASPFWAQLANGFVDLQSDESTRRRVSLFASTLHSRHPRSLQAFAHIHDQLVTFLEQSPKDGAGNPLISEVEYGGNVAPFDSSGFAEFNSAGREDVRQDAVSSIRELATWFAEALMEKRWSVASSEAPVFVTTDTPVAISNRRRQTYGIRTPGTIVSVPLSPARVLVMDDLLDQPKGQYYPLNADGSAVLNLAAWHCCERFMVSPRHPDQICAEIVALSERPR